MKDTLALAVGIAVGDAIYQIARCGLHHVDWVKVAFMLVFTAVVFAAISKLRSAKGAK